MEKINVAAKDGKVIPTIFYEVDNESKKGVVIICHGFGEHSASYLEVAKVMWNAGYASAILDQRGHGMPPENVKKFYGVIPNYQCFIDDVMSVVERVKEIAPDAPLVLFGHSMGGNIAINTLLRMSASQSKQFSCAVLEAPWFALYKPADAFTVCLVKFLNVVAPNHTISSKIKHEDICADDQRSDEYKHDPLYHNQISARMITGILVAGGYAIDNAERLVTPTLLAYADNEKMVNNEAMLKFARNAGDLVTVKEYDSNHAIHNDKSSEQYFRDVIEFLDLHVSK